jgi:hypothetical protein
MANNSQKSSKAAPPPAVVEEEPTVKEDFDGWDSPPVRAARAFCEAAYGLNDGTLAKLIDGEGVNAWRIEQAEEAAKDLAADAEPPELPTPWAELDAVGRQAFVDAEVANLLEDEDPYGPAKWKPFEGSALEYEFDHATVHLKVAGRSEETVAENRVLEFSLLPDGDGPDRQWRITSWKRFLTPEELRNMRVSRQKEVTKVELSDGSKLYVADPRPLPHLEDTPPAVRAEIDEAIVRLTDFSLHPKENNKALGVLVANGKASIPILLTALYNIQIVDDPTAAQVNLVVQALRDITGEYFGFKPHESMGVGNERRDAGIKAWFGWWIRRGEKKFTEREEGEDLLDQLEATERDKQDEERARRAAERRGEGQ